MTNRNRRGLALIELITGICVVLILTALQLPAVARAREAARRSQCVNNMKQMGLGLHNYHSANGVFPMSAVVGPGHGNGQGYTTIVLPYIEQVPVYNAYNFDLENWHRANSTAVGVKMVVYLCPSNTEIEPTKAKEIKTHHGKPYPGTSVFAASHYGANWGGVRPASGADVAKAYPGSHLGTLLTVVDPDAPKPTTNIGIRNITDGTSYTLASVEKLSSFGWGVGGWGGTEFDVYTKPLYDGKDATLRKVFTGSNHPDGLNVLMCDGAVRFLKADLEPKVWRALTTRAGGEVIRLD